MLLEKLFQTDNVTVLRLKTENIVLYKVKARNFSTFQTKDYLYIIGEDIKEVEISSVPSHTRKYSIETEDSTDNLAGCGTTSEGLSFSRSTSLS